MEVLADEFSSDVQVVVLIDAHIAVQACLGGGIVLGEGDGVVPVLGVEENQISYWEAGWVVLHAGGKVYGSGGDDAPGPDKVLKLILLHLGAQVGPPKLFGWPVHLEEDVGTAVAAVVDAEAIVLDVAPAVDGDVFDVAAKVLHDGIGGEEGLDVGQVGRFEDENVSNGPGGARGEAARSRTRRRRERERERARRHE